MLKTNFKVFRGLIFYIDESLAENCRDLITAYGGSVEEVLSKKVTHIISVKKSSYPSELIKTYRPILHEEWLVECLNVGILIEMEEYILSPHYVGFIGAKKLVKEKLLRSFVKEKNFNKKGGKKRNKKKRKKKKKRTINRRNNYAKRSITDFFYCKKKIDCVLSSKREYGSLQYQIQFTRPKSYKELILKPERKKKQTKWIAKRDLIMSGNRELLRKYHQNIRFKNVIKKALNYRNKCIEFYKDHLETYLKYKGQYISINSSGKLLYRGKNRRSVEIRVSKYMTHYNIHPSDPITPLIIQVGRENETLFPPSVKKNLRFASFSEGIKALFPTCKCSVFRSKGKQRLFSKEIKMIQDTGSIDGSLTIDHILRMKLVPVNFEIVNKKMLPVFICSVILDGLILQGRFHSDEVNTIGMDIMKNFDMRIDYQTNTNTLKAQKRILRNRKIMKQSIGTL